METTFKRRALFVLRGVLYAIIGAAEGLGDLAIRMVYGFILSLIMLSLGAGMGVQTNGADPNVFSIVGTAAMFGAMGFALIGLLHDLSTGPHFWEEEFWTQDSALADKIAAWLRKK